MLRLLLTCIAGLTLSSCATFEPLYEDVVDAMPWQEDDLGEATFRSAYIADDLVEVFEGHTEPMSAVSIVTKESDEWAPLETELRREGHAVSLVKRMRHAASQPIVYTITEVLEGRRVMGVLDVVGKMRLSRFYEVGEDYVMQGSSVTVHERENEND